MQGSPGEGPILVAISAVELKRGQRQRRSRDDVGAADASDSDWAGRLHTVAALGITVPAVQCR